MQLPTSFDDVITLAKGLKSFSLMPKFTDDGRFVWFGTYVRFFHAKRDQEGLWTLKGINDYDDISVDKAVGYQPRIFVELLPRYVWMSTIKCKYRFDTSTAEYILASVPQRLQGPLWVNRTDGVTGTVDIIFDAEDRTIEIGVPRVTMANCTHYNELAEYIYNQCIRLGLDPHMSFNVTEIDNE